MTDFYKDPVYKTARKEHKCIYCAETIFIGEKYVFQIGNYDGKWFENKMHLECFQDCWSQDDDVFTPYSNERPKKEN